ncbi:MAG: SRPBCC family protein [Casimicrobiaceae bacterium]
MQIMSIKGELAWPARTVWDIVSDFGGLKHWNPALISCTLEGTGVGSARTFATKAATVVERVDAFDAGAMRIGYSIVSGSTIKARHASLTIAVRALDPTRSELTWTFDGEPDGIAPAELTEQLERRYLGRIDDLRATLAADDHSAPKA